MSKLTEAIDKLDSFTTKDFTRDSWSSSLLEGAVRNSFLTEYQVLEVLGEAVEYEFSADEKGGIIVLSTDVNAVNYSDNKVMNKIKQLYNTIKHKFTRNSTIDKVITDQGIENWTIGKGFKGRYTSKGKTFSEDSISVEIIGITTETLNKIAEELCREFTQECVLVKNYIDNNVYLMNRD